MKKQKDIMLILIPGFILALLWVIFNIYHNNVTSTINEPLSIQIKEIPGNFDSQTIEKIKQRERTDPIYELDAVPTVEPIDEIEPSIEPEPTPIASDSAEVVQE